MVKHFMISESLNFRKNKIPTRALRMVTPNEKHRIDLEGIAQRSIQGDISIVNLGELTHMQSQQNFLRRNCGCSLKIPDYTFIL